jgi:hypothetical protein
VKLGGNGAYELIAKNKAKFREQLSELLKGRPEIASEITSKGYTIDHIEEIIENYNK